jgi:hypothetical protein
MKMKFSSKLMSNVKILSYSRLMLVAAAVAGPIIYALVTGELTSLLHMSISRSDLVTLYQPDGGGNKGVVVSGSS